MPTAPAVADHLSLNPHRFQPEPKMRKHTHPIVRKGGGKKKHMEKMTELQKERRTLGTVRNFAIVVEQRADGASQENNNINENDDN
ncbi:hypothetical protein EJB05_15103, partial [Eragrostis curvula]